MLLKFHGYVHQKKIERHARVRKKMRTCHTIKFIFFVVILFSAYHLQAISIHEEEELSIKFLDAVHKQFHVIEDPLITEYINGIGKRIIDAMPVQPLDYHFYVIKNEAFNAFAGPGAHIFINSGLITALKSEEELAGIVSHEIAHVSSRHISSRIEKAKKIQIGSLLGMIAGAVVAASNPKDGSAIITSTMAASQTAMLAFSREHEMQADHVGFVNLKNAGYSGKGFVSALETMRKSQVYDTSRVPTYLLTHPSSTERVAYMQSVLKSMGTESGNSREDQDLEFYMIQTWISGNLEPVEKAENKFSGRISKDSSDHQALYGAALVMSRKNNHLKSVELLEKALNFDLMNTLYREELGKQYFLNGEIRKSVELLEYLESDTIQSRFYLAKGYHELSRYSDATEIFEQIIADDPSYDKARYFLALSYGNRGEKDLAHYHLGLYYADLKDKENAEFHLKKAMRLLKDAEKKKHASETLKNLMDKKKKK